MSKKTPEKILTAFDQSKTKSITEICRLAGITRKTYYNQLAANTDLEVKILRKQREIIDRRIAAIA